MNPGGKVRIFVFGVGVDVNPVFLDKLALDNHGVPTYVRPNEDVERKVASLYDKVRYPVLTDVRVDFGGISPTEVLPGVTPDLFRGGQIVIAGRYKRGGKTDVVVSGRDGEQGREFHYVLSAGSEGQGLRDDFPARVWAVRRIGDLVDQIRLLGRPEKELVDEIVRLSTRFGIMTEYTSFLADENADLGRVADNRLRALEELSRARGDAGPAAGGGAAGFAFGENQKARREADKPVPAAPTTPGDAGMGDGAFGPPVGQTLAKAKDGDRDLEDEVIRGVRNVANRAFYRKNVAGKTAWVDSTVKEQQRVDERIVRWSPRFFDLIKSTSAEENTRLSQDGDVLLVIEGRNLLVTDADDGGGK
jgi:Ca-activated chloride channel family protein